MNVRPLEVKKGMSLQGCILTLALLASPLPQAQTVESLADVKILYVESMAGSDRTERFRGLVAKELADRGFLVTESENADVRLTGVLTATALRETYERETGGIITVTPPNPRLYWECKAVLKNRKGTVLWKWEGSAGSKRFLQTVHVDPLFDLAVKLAMAMEKDYRKSQKKKIKS